MKTGLLLLALFAVSYGQPCAKAKALQRHIYNPERLVEKKGCITVSGTVRKKLIENDGDWHIGLELDKGQPPDLINDANKGTLVLEILCVNKVTQPDAIKVCKNWKQKIEMPNVGDHVRVRGIHVLDKDHGFLELHPVTGIRIIR